MLDGKVLLKGLLKMLSIFYVRKEVKKKNIIVVIGPCISVNNYEIQKDFLMRFLKINKKNEVFFKFKGKKIYFDLKKYIQYQLTKIGIKKIEIIHKDTYKLKNSYFSARRSLAKKDNDYGRNISIIMIN